LSSSPPRAGEKMPAGQMRGAALQATAADAANSEPNQATATALAALVSPSSTLRVTSPPAKRGRRGSPPRQTGCRLLTIPRDEARGFVLFSSACGGEDARRADEGGFALQATAADAAGGDRRLPVSLSGGSRPALRYQWGISHVPVWRMWGRGRGGGDRPRTRFRPAWVAGRDPSGGSRPALRFCSCSFQAMAWMPFFSTTVSRRSAGPPGLLTPRSQSETKFLLTFM